MEYKITKLKNDKGLDIDIVNIINSNNWCILKNHN